MEWKGIDNRQFDDEVEEWEKPISFSFLFYLSFRFVDRCDYAESLRSLFPTPFSLLIFWANNFSFRSSFTSFHFDWTAIESKISLNFVSFRLCVCVNACRCVSVIKSKRHFVFCFLFVLHFHCQHVTYDMPHIVHHRFFFSFDFLVVSARSFSFVRSLFLQSTDRISSMTTTKHCSKPFTSLGIVFRLRERRRDTLTAKRKSIIK